MSHRPVLCLVTDRRRLAAACGTPDGDWEPLVAAQIEGAIAGGIDLVLIRERDLDANRLALVVRRALALADGSTARIVVNDRLDVAVAAGAHGVHLREDSMPAAAVKPWIQHRLTIGRSIHSAEGARTAGPVDYLLAGTVFESASKSETTVTLGKEGLGHIVRCAGEVPVFAIGGITEAMMATVVAAGARGVAGIGLFLPPPGCRNVAGAVQKNVEKLRFAFDSASAVS
jgi:thiamine-phosphate pyrophosphorylase